MEIIHQNQHVACLVDIVNQRKRPAEVVIAFRVKLTYVHGWSNEC